MKELIYIIDGQIMAIKEIIAEVTMTYNNLDDRHEYDAGALAEFHKLIHSLNEKLNKLEEAKKALQSEPNTKEW